MDSYESAIGITAQLSTELKNDVCKRIGTHENYILLNPKYVERKLLKKWIGRDELKKADFAKFNQSGDDNTYHIINLISAPDMSPDTLKLGLYIFQRAINKERFQFVFSLLDDDVKKSVFGDERALYIGKPNLSKSEYYQMPFLSLLRLLEKDNVSLQSRDLLPMLQTLHDFGFITLTPIDTQHCINQNLPTIDTKCIHIDINYGAITAKFNRRWELQKSY